jgi:hypothetical protein
MNILRNDDNHSDPFFLIKLIIMIHSHFKQMKQYYSVSRFFDRPENI